MGSGAAKISPGSTLGARSLVSQMKSNLHMGSKSCPIVNELTNIGQGIAQGDLNKVALNSGAMALYSTTLLSGSSSTSSGFKSVKTSGLKSTGMMTFAT